MILRELIATDGRCRVGVDVVTLGRVRAALDRHGEPFAESIFSSRERELIRGDAPGFVEARFGAKEAALKCLGTGLVEGTSLLEIDTCALVTLGQPFVIRAAGRTGRLFQRVGCSTLVGTAIRRELRVLVWVQGSPS